MVIRTGILCVPIHDDEAVDLVSQFLRSALPNLFVVETSSAQSQLHWVEELLRRWCDEEELDLVVTIGGTSPAVGPGANEIVPQATLNVVERTLPGLSEAMRAYAQAETALALLDRGVAGIRSRSLILNLPEGAAAASLFLEAIVDLIEPIMAYLDETQPSPRIADTLILEDSDNPDIKDRAVKDIAVDETFTTGTEGAESWRKKTTESAPKKKGLDPAEFAEYLANRQKRNDSS